MTRSGVLHGIVLGVLWLSACGGVTSSDTTPQAAGGTGGAGSAGTDATSSDAADAETGVGGQEGCVQQSDSTCTKLGERARCAIQGALYLLRPPPRKSPASARSQPTPWPAVQRSQKPPECASRRLAATSRPRIVAASCAPAEFRDSCRSRALGCLQARAHSSGRRPSARSRPVRRTRGECFRPVHANRW